MAATLTLDFAALQSSSTFTTHTWSGKTVAAASGQERLVFVGGITNGGASTGDFSALTVDGQPATKIGTAVRGATTGADCALMTVWRVNGTANTTIDIVATHVTDMYSVEAACYKMSNAGTVLATVTSTSASPTLSLNTATNGTVAAAFVGYSGSSSVLTWTGLTERFDAIRAFGDDVFSGASADITTGETPRTVTATTDLSGGSAADSVASIAVSFNLSPLVQSAEGLGTTTTTNVSFSTLPTAGNLIVLAWSGALYSDVTVNAGWFQATVSQGNYGHYIWWRIADGTNGDAAHPYPYSLNGTQFSSWVMAEFSGVDQIDVAGWEVSAAGNFSTSGTPSIAPSTGQRLMIASIMGGLSSVNISSASDDDLTSWTNSFTHVASHGGTSGDDKTMVSLAYRVVTGDDSTTYSTGATFPTTAATCQSAIASFRAVGNLSADTAPALRAIDTVTYGSRANTTLNKPTGTVDNDILIASVFQGFSSGSFPDVTPPSGFRMLLQSIRYVTDSGFFGRFLLYWKRAASEGSTYTWTHATSSTQIALTAWSGCVTTGIPIDSWTYNGDNTRCRFLEPDQAQFDQLQADCHRPQLDRQCEGNDRRRVDQPLRIRWLRCSRGQ